jgi:hypothetical protein
MPWLIALVFMVGWIYLDWWMDLILVSIFFLGYMLYPSLKIILKEIRNRT